MADMMTFPDTWEEFEEQYGFTDKKQIYTNGSRLIQSFRVKQWLDHLESEHKQADTPQTDCPFKDVPCSCGEQDECEWHTELDTPQTDCETCKYGQDKHRYAHICNECGVGINNYTPQTDCGWK